MEFRPRRVQIDDSLPVQYDVGDDGDEEERSMRLRHRSSNSVTEDQEPFMGMKVRRKASLHRDYKGDYLDVPSHPFLMKILQKQVLSISVYQCDGKLWKIHIALDRCSLELESRGDKRVLFADKVLKFTASGKMKRRILLITDFAIYIIDPEMDALKRRIALAAVDKMCLSELSDNFFTIIVPTEYDLLIASTRKSEIVTVLVEATKSASDYELEVVFSNRFEYHASSDMVKEVQFEEVDGGVKTRIAKK